MTFREINKELGNIDLELLDQLLKGRIDINFNILDAGCGEGRNLHYFVRNDFNVFGFDASPDAINYLRLSLGSLNKSYDPERFWVDTIENVILPTDFFDMIICHNVLHYAKDTQHFRQLIYRLKNLLKKEGFLSIRMKTVDLIDGPDQSITYALEKSMEKEISVAFDIIENKKIQDFKNQYAYQYLLCKNIIYQ